MQLLWQETPNSACWLLFPKQNRAGHNPRGFRKPHTGPTAGPQTLGQHLETQRNEKERMMDRRSALDRAQRNQPRGWERRNNWSVSNGDSV